MQRYNASPSERNHPFAVEIPVPEDGFGPQLDLMQGWAKERKIAWTIGRNSFDKGRFFQTWRFKTEKDAADFAATFGGTVTSTIQTMNKPRSLA